MSLLFRTPLMMVDSIRVWTESSRMLDFSGKDTQSKSFILECPKREPKFVSNLLGKSVFVRCLVFQLILAYWHQTRTEQFRWRNCKTCTTVQYLVPIRAIENISLLGHNLREIMKVWIKETPSSFNLRASHVKFYLVNF